MSDQQLLRLDSAVSADFSSFWGGPNQAVLDLIGRFSLSDDSGSQLLIGAAGSGKSHLAHAACRQRWAGERSAVYLPLAEAALNEDSLAGVSAAGLIVVDDLQALRVADELPLLRLIDRSRGAQGKLLLCSRQWPDQLEVQTPDLRSRLQWGVMLELRSLDEDGLSAMLQHRASCLGVLWSERLSQYLLRRLPRDPAALVEAQDRVYRQAVAQRRQITVPFLRELVA